jgi:hypothetical protein
LTGQLAGAGIAEVRLLRTAARVAEVEPHDGAFTLVDF